MHYYGSGMQLCVCVCVQGCYLNNNSLKNKNKKVNLAILKLFRLSQNAVFLIISSMFANIPQNYAMTIEEEACIGDWPAC